MVLVKEDHGYFAFLCTDPRQGVQEILEAFADWASIEQDFHDVTEVGGAGQRPVRNVWINLAADNLNLWRHTLLELVPVVRIGLDCNSDFSRDSRFRQFDTLLIRLTDRDGNSMPGKAAKVVITDRQDKILRAIVASRTSPVRLIERAKIILLAFEKKLNQEISHIVPLNPQQIGLWRKVLAQSEAGGPGSVRPSGAMRL